MFGAEEKLDITSLRKAIDSLERSLNTAERFRNSADNDAIEAIRAGVVQHFEFTYELCWKFMKRWLEENASPDFISGAPRAELFRVSAENALITDVGKWIDFHKARNSTSHMYNESIALNVFEKAVEFFPYAKDFYRRLEVRL